MAPKKFKRGDKVTWTSESGSFKKIKIGVVIEVVRVGGIPDMKDTGMQRDHESYFVLAHHKGKTVKRKYWPRVSQLRPAK